MVFENPVGAVLDPDSARVTGTILNDDLPPVTVAAVAATVTEGEAAAFRLRRPDLDTSEALVVSFTVADPAGVLSGTAPATATIAAGETEETVSLDTVDDGDHEAHGSLTLTLAAGADYVLGPEAERSAEVTVRDNDDSPATGSVTVTGTATEGQTLTADTSGITDEDGLDNAAYAWQWVRTPSGGSDEDISGATSETYVPVYADAGATLKVKVTVTDDEGHDATFESAPTSAVAALPRPEVTVASDGDVTEGATVTFTLTRTVDTTGTLDVAYEVTASGDFGAATGTGTATFPANSPTVQVSVDTTDDATHEAHGSVTVTLTADTGADPAWLLGDPSTATAAVEDDDDSPASGTVTVTGTATEGQTLTADTSGLTDEDGLANAAYAWQWVRTPSGGSDEDISGATSQTWVPVFADAGATLKVRVTVTDDEGHQATITSTPTSAVAALPRVSVVHGGSPITEGGDATFTFTLSKTIGDIPLRVNIRRTETGNMMFPNNLGRSVVVFGPNQTTLTVSYPTVDDDTTEPNSTVTVEVLERNYYMPGTPSMASVEVRDDDDSPATGTVTVTGTATEGQTLTADTSGLADEDGLDNASYVYQWVRTPSGGSDADISGATSQTYVPVFADAGATLKVKVTVTDDEGHEASFTSAATSAVAARARPSVTVVSDGDVTEGSAAVFTLTRTGDPAQTLDVDYEVTATGDFGAATGAGTATFPANDATVQVSVATTGDDTHEAHGSVTLTLTPDTGADPAYLLGAPSTATAAVEDDDDSPATGTVTVTGTPTEGETLTADTSGIADADGLGNAAEVYVYQWVRTPTGGSDEDISGATSQTYVPVFADAGATLKVRVEVTDDEGHQATFTSTPTSAVAALPRPSVTVASDGDVTEGSPALFTLTRTGATTGTLDVTYDVTVSGDFGVTTGAGTATFPANSATVQVSVATTDDSTHETHGSVTLTLTADTGTDPAYVLGAPSTATAMVRDDDDSPTTGSVTVTGTPTEGQTLTANTTGLTDEDGLDNAAYVYQWVRTPSGGSDEDISGATSRTYTPVIADAGATLKVRVTVTDDEGHEATITSAPTSAVAALRPSVTVASDGDVTEGSPALFTLTRTGATAGTLDVAWEVAATGDFGVTTGAGTATFLANSATVQVSVATTGDSAHEAHGSVTLTLTADTSANPAYLLGDPSTATAVVRDDDNAEPTGAPTIDDTTPEVGQTLTASTSGIDDPDGLATPRFTWQWIRVPSGGGTETRIGGATAASYTVVAADEGETLKVEVGFTDDDGTTETLTSAATMAVEAAAPTVPEVSIVPGVGGSLITEGGKATFTMTISEPPAASILLINIRITETGAMMTSNNLGDIVIAFVSGQQAAMLSYTTVADDTDEPNSTVTVEIVERGGSNYVPGTPSMASVEVRDDDRPDGNAAPTGAPTIDDTTPAVGETLTAAPSDLDDPDGLTSPTYAWRWIRVASGGVETVVGTGMTYVVVAADAGARLKVEATFTDDAGIEETVESAETSAVEVVLLPMVSVAPVASSVEEGAGAQFTVTRTVVTAGALTVNYGVSETGDMVASGEEGAKTVAFADGETRQTVTVPTEDDTGHEADSTVTLTLTADAAYALGTDATAEVMVEDDDNAAPTGKPTIDDTTPVVGETLTADPSGIDDPDGLTSPTYTWQWIRVASDTTETEVGTGTTYTVVDADMGAKLKVEATFTDDDETEEMVESAETETVEATPLLELSIADASVDEGDSGSTTLNFTVTLDSAATETVTVDWATSDGTAEAGTDYTAGNETLTINTGDSSGTVSVTVLGDEVDEPNETFTVTLTNPSGATLGNDTATGTITDDDDPPTVTLVLTPDTITEAGGVSTVTATLDHPSSEATTVTVTAAPVSPAVAGDYTLSGSQLTIPEGATDSTGTVTITAVDNPVHAPDKTVTVSATATNAQGITTPQDVTLTILDDDNAAPTGAPTIDDTTPVVGETLTADPSGIDDPDGLTSPTYTWQWIRVSGSTETDIATSETYTVVAADVGATLKVEASFTDDGGTEETVESAETATVEAAPTLPALSIADARVNEGDTGSKTLDFTVTLDSAATETVTVDWATSDGTATAGTDYTAGNGTLTFSSGDSSQTVSVTVAGDNVDEPNETFTVTLTNPSGATLGDDTATGTIIDNDARPTVTLVLTPASISEDGGVSMVTARLDHPSSEATTVTVTAAPVSPAVAGDYTLSGSELTIAAGATASTGTVTITAVDNAVDAPHKTVTVSATATNTQGITAPQDVTLTILDDENVAPTGKPTIDDETPVVGETLTADTSGIGDSDGLAGAAYAYRWLRVAAGGAVTQVGTGQSYTVVAADVGSTLKVEVTFTDEGGTEETVESLATAAAEAAIEAPTTIFRADLDPIITRYRTTTTVNLADYLATGVMSSAVTFAVDDCGATSGATPSDFYQSITLSDSTLSLVSNELGHTHGASTETETECEVTGTVGAESETRTFSFQIIPPRALLTVQTPEVSVVGRHEDALEVQVRDPSGLGRSWLRLAWRETGTSAWENRIMSGAALRSSNPPVIRIEGLESATTYTVQAAVLTREAFDYYANGRTIAERVLTELAPGLDGKWIANMVGGGQSRAGRAEGTTLPVLSVGDASVDEGDTGSTTLDFTVTLDSAATETVTVEWATSDGTATAGTDYTAGNGTVTFNSGDSSKTVSVTVLGDEVDEPNETFEVTLTNPSGAALGDDTATGTITDDDDPPTVTLVLTPASIAEAAGQSTVTATLDHPSSEETTVTVSVSPQSPAVAGDYTLSSNLELTIAAGSMTSTGTVTITAVDNSVYEGDKTVTVSGTATNTLGITAPQNVTLTITDDEPAPPPPELSIGDASVDEGDTGSTTLNFTVTLDSAATETVTVEWATSDGTATAGTDYTAGNGTVTFNSGDSSQTVSVTVAGDNVDEPNETFTVTLTNPSGATLGDDTATGTITDDDDAPTVTLVLTPASIAEAAGQSTVTATLDHPSSEETTVTVSVTPQSPATASDYTLSSNLELTIAAGSMTSTGTVTILAVNNSVYEGDKTVTVSGTATNTLGITAPQNVTLTITDDEPAPPTIFRADLDPIITRYRTTTTVNLADYLATGVASSSVTFAVDDCGATSGATPSDFYQSITLSDSTLSLVSNELGHTHGSSTETETECEVTGTVGAESETRTFSFQIIPPRALLTVQTPEVSVVGRHEDALEVQVRDPSGLGRSWLRLAWRETGTSAWENRIMSGAALRSSNPPVIRIEGLESATTYTVQAAVLTREAFDYYANGRTIAERVLTELASGLDGKWIANMVGGGQSRSGRAEGTTTDGPLPTVAVAPVASPVAEGADAQFRVTRTVNTTGALTVRYSVSETGEMVASGDEGAKTVDFADGDTEQTVTVPTVADSAHEADSVVTVTLTADAAYDVGTGTATVTVEDDDSPATGTVTITGTPTESETLTADTSGISDADGLDNAAYTYQWVRTPSGGSDADISGATSQTYTPVFADVGATLKVRVTVTDDEGHQATFTSAATAPVAALPLPVVTVASNGDVTEGSPAVFTLTRTGDTAEILDVFYEVTATGDFGVTTASATATFLANSATVQVSIDTTGDSAHEAHGSVTVTLQARPAYTLGTDAAATAAVRDDDNAAPTGAVTIDDTTPVVGETLTADASSIDDPDGLTSRSFTWQWVRVSGGTETEIAGATAASYKVVDADVGATLKAAVSFTDDDGTDETVESDETAAATKPVVTVASDGDVTEGSPALFTLTRTGSTAETLAVAYDVAATAGFGVTTGAATVTFQASSATVQVSVATTGDSDHEAHGSVTVTLTAVQANAAYVLGTDAAATAAVRDDDNAAPTGKPTIDDTTPVVAETLTADASGIDDPDGLTNRSFTYQWIRTSGGTNTRIAGATAASYTVVKADVDATLKVEVGFTDDDATDEIVESDPTGTVLDNDDSPTTGAVTITGTPTEGETLTADTSGLQDDDGLTSATYTYQWVRTPSGGSDTDISGATSDTYTPVFLDAGATLKVRVTVTDDRGFQATLTSDPVAVAALPRPVVTVASDGDVTEGSPAVFTLTRTGDTAEILDVAYDVTASGDFGVTTASDTASFPANGATVQVSLATTGDTTDEVDGSVTLTLQANPIAYTLGTDAAATAAVEDDDNAPTVTLVLTPASIAEAAGQSTVTATLDHPSSEATTVTVSVAPQSPATTSDYTPSSNLELTIAAGDTTSTGTVTITAVDNAAHGPDKTVTVSATATNTLGITAPQDVTLTITDDDNAAPTGAPTIDDTTPVVGETLTADSSGIADPDGLTGATFTWQWIRVSGSTQTRISGATSATYTVVAGDVGATLKVEASFTDDDGTDETLESAETAAAEAAPPMLSIGDASVDEGDSGSATLDFTVTLDRTATETVTVDWATSDGTATAGTDYTAGNGTLTFNAGDSSETVSVTVAGDNVDEPNETFTVTLSSASGAAISDGTATGTITDDDATPTVTLVLSPDSITEVNAQSTVTATLNHPSSEETTVTVSVSPVSPAVAGDYTLSTNRVLTIAAGSTTSTGTVTVTSVNNTVDAPDKTVTVSGTATNTQGVTDPDDVTLTIRDNDATPTVTLVLTPNPITEVNQQSTVTATLDHPSSEATTVTVSVSPDSPAVAGDYTLSTNRVLTIAAGSTTSTGTVTVTSVNNTVDAPDKTVTVSATATNDQGVTAPNDVTLTIRDNDATPTVTLVLTPASITEAGGTSTVTATLNHPSSNATTVTVSASPVSPAVAGDYTLSGNLDLTIAAGATTSTGTVTITAVDNDVVAAAKEVTVSATATNAQGVTAPDDVTLTITDDDEPGLSIADASVDEGDSGASATLTFTVTLNPAALSQVTVDWATADGTARAGTDYTAGSGSLTFNAGDSTKTVSVTVTGDDVDEPNETLTVRLSNASGATIADAEATGTIRDDDDAPTVTLVLTPNPITEVNQQSTVTATLDHPSSNVTTVTVSVSPVSPAVAGDYTLSTNRVLTIAAGSTASTGTVTVTSVNNTVDAPHKTVTVSATATNTQGITAPNDVTLTIRDNDATPTVTLVLSSNSIPEAGGTSTVTATLNHPSSNATTVTVSVSPVSPAVSGDYTLSGSQLTIAAGQTTSTGTVTVTAVDNTADTPDKTVTVSGAASNGQGVTDPAPVTLTIEDDDGPPTVTLVLSPDSITEANEQSTVTATLDRVSGADTTVTVSVAPVSPAVAGDYTLSANRELTIPAGSTTSTGTVTVTSVNNAVDAPHKTVTVSATATNTQGITAPNPVTLTIEDDDDAPKVTLVLSPDSITEVNAQSTVTATLDHPSSEATTVTVSVSPVSPAVAGDYTLSSNRVLTIPAGQTTSTGTVTVTSVNNAVDAPHKTVTVSGTATNSQGVTDPDDVTLTIRDNDATPTVTLVLTPNPITEVDGQSTVTATLDHPSSEATTVTVSVVPDSPAVAGDYRLSTNRVLTIAAGQTESTGTVTVTGVDNTADTPDKTVTVSGAASNGQGVTGPAPVTLTIEDDDGPPTVTLVLSPDSITEANEQSTVTATLDRVSGADTTVTVSVSPVSSAVAGDYRLSANRELTIPAGSTTSTGTVTVTSVNNAVDAPHKTVTVSGTATNSQGVTAPDDVTLTIRDNDATPTVTLVLSPDSITEVNAQSTVTATLNHPSSEETTVTVSVAPVSPAVAGDYRLSTNRVLTIAAGQTTSTGTVTVTSVNNTVDAPHKTVTVSGTATNSQGVTDPQNMTLTIRDNDATPTVTLVLSSNSIPEAGGTSTVTATLNHPSSEETTVTVSVSPVSPAVMADYMLSSNRVLTIAAGATTSTGTVTITAVDNDVVAAAKEVTVSATATNRQGVTDPQGVTLTIREDDMPGLSVADASVAEGDSGGTAMTFTVMLNPAALSPVTVDWATADGTARAGTDYTAENGSLTFGVGDSSKTVSVTVTGDNVDEPDETLTVTLSSASGATIADAEATGTIRDDDDEPKVTLVLTPASITEVNEQSTVTATLDRPSSEATTVTVSVAPVSPAVAGDYRLSGNTELTIPAGATTSTGTVTVTSVNNAVDAPHKTVRVSGTATNRQGVTDPAPVTLTIRDNDAAPTVTLHLSPDTISEAGGTSTVTATLNHPSSEETTVTVSAAPESPAVSGDYTLSGNRVLTIAAGATTSTGTVTVTSVDNTVDAPHKTVTVSGTAENAQGVTDPAPVTLTITDDDELTLALSVSPGTVSEGDGETTVTVTATVTGITLGEARKVTISVAGSGEDAAVDFADIAPFDIVIPAGLPGTSASSSFVLVPEDDVVDEAEETLRVSGRVDGMDGAMVTEAVLTLTDDDDPPTGIELSVTPEEVSEGDGETTVTVTATVTGGTRFGVARTVMVSVAGSGESRAVDFAEVAEFPVMVPAGAESGTGTFVLIPEDDERDELDETVMVGGCLREAGTGGCLSLQEFPVTAAQMRLTDDDGVSLSVDDVVVREDAGEAVFTLRLSHPSERAIEVAATFTDGTAKRGEDYRPDEERVVFGRGETERELRVALVDNEAMGRNKTFEVTFEAMFASGEGSTERLEASTASATCTIVDDEVADARGRRLEYALAWFGRTVVQDLVTAVEDRRWATSAGTTATLAGTRLPLSEEAVYETLRRHTDPDGDLVAGTDALRELLSRSSFQLSLGGEGEAGGTGMDSLVLWGRGSQSWSAGRLDSEVGTQGEVLSGQLGVELRPWEDTLVGVMLNGSAGELEFDGELDAEVETEVLGVHPYAQWSPREGLRTWAMVGYGAGEATLTDEYSALGGTDLEMMMAAGGGSHDVASLWGIDWSVGTNGFFVQLDADEVRFDAEGQAALVPAVKSEVWQMRLLLEGSAGEDFGGVEGLRGNVELAARVDGGDAESGMGMEVGGGVVYGRADLGIEVEASGRMLLTHEEEGLEDAGVSLALEFDPGARGRGVYFALAPSWGNAASGARSMWEDRQPTAVGSVEGDRFDPQMRLSSELGYTAPTPLRRGTLTTYGAFSSAGGASRQYRVGRRLELGIVSMSLEAERHESSGATPEHGVWLRGNLRF